MEIRQHISDTAFLVNESRARRVDISRDTYAQHWVLPERREAIRALWDDFARRVYPHDDVELSLRSRFMLEHLQAFARAHPDALFVNVGAGCTSYPFLLEQPVRCLEIDYPNVVTFKQKRLRQLQVEGKLPCREVVFLPADIADATDRQRMETQLRAEHRGPLSFVLLEGITYYLPMAVQNSLLDLFRKLQPAGSLLVLDYWKPELARHPVFLRLQRFFANRFGYEEPNYNLFDEAVIRSIVGYDIVKLTNVVEQEPVYAGSRVLQDNPYVLLENYAVLARQ